MAKDINNTIERENNPRERSLDRMRKLIAIPKPSYLNSGYRLDYGNVVLPEGFTDHAVDMTKEGLETIREVSHNPNAKLAVLLSGGVDSSVVLQMGYNAVGPQNIVALTMEHLFVGERERQDHKKRDGLIAKLGVEEVRQDITNLINTQLNNLGSFEDARRLFEERPELLEIYKAEAIARARINAMQNYCSLEELYPIDTGNLTESVYGQYTIGDSSGFALSILAPLLKGEVRRFGKELGLDRELCQQEKRTGEFGFAGDEQLGASDDYLDPIANLYLTGNSFKIIAKKTKHDSEWIKKLGSRVNGKARIVRASTGPIIDIETGKSVPTFREVWQDSTKDREGLQFKLQMARNIYIPRG